MYSSLNSFSQVSVGSVASLVKASENPDPWRSLSLAYVWCIDSIVIQRQIAQHVALSYISGRDSIIMSERRCCGACTMMSFQFEVMNLCYQFTTCTLRRMSKFVIKNIISVNVHMSHCSTIFWNFARCWENIWNKFIKFWNDIWEYWSGSEAVRIDCLQWCYVIYIWYRPFVDLT